MKCERCGNQLDDTDLFCQKCGKAVFEEYMDDDDIWEEYDREPPKKKAKEQKKPEIVEQKTEEETKKEKTEPKQQIVEQPESKKVPQKNKTLSKESSPKKKSPLGLICACTLIVCLLVGVLWGALTVKQMDAKEKEETKTTLKNNQEQENQSSSSSENTKTEETVKPEETKEEETKAEETKPEEQEQVTETQPEEVKKQDYFVMVDKDSIDFNQFTKLTVTNAEQSSMASSDNYDYSANSAVDGDVTSSWQEGVDGLGEGTGIKLTLDGTHKIRYMVLYLGNWRSDEMWQKNARPAKLSINLGDNQAKDVEFSDEKKAFCLSFDEPVEASFVSLYIEAGYAGSKWNDNCISEVELYE